MLDLLTNVAGAFLIIVGVLALMGFLSNAKMMQQDPYPSEEDKRFSVAALVTFVCALGLGFILIKIF